MKKYLIKVNGNQYDVEIEEMYVSSCAETHVSSCAIQAATPAPSASAAVSAPVSAETSVAAGSVKITAPMPGTVLKVEVNVGDQVKKNQVLLILEAMKMENEIVAPANGTVATLSVTKGTTVNAGDLMVSLS